LNRIQSRLTTSYRAPVEQGRHSYTRLCAITIGHKGCRSLRRFIRNRSSTPTWRTRFSLPLQDPLSGDESSGCNIPKQSQLGDLIRQTKLILWMRHLCSTKPASQPSTVRCVISLESLKMAHCLAVFRASLVAILPKSCPWSKRVREATLSELISSALMSGHTWESLRYRQKDRHVRISRCQNAESGGNHATQRRSSPRCQDVTIYRGGTASHSRRSRHREDVPRCRDVQAFLR